MGDNSLNINAMRKNETGILDFFSRHNREFSKKVGYSRAKVTYDRYQTVFRHLERYIHSKYRKPDLQICRLRHSFVVGFDDWLRRKAGLAPNSVWNYMIALKHILSLAQDEGLVKVNLFSSYVNSYTPVDRGYLSEEELVRLMQEPSASPVEELVRDLFLFSAFTGLSYVDIKELRTGNLRRLFDGNWWIVTRRHKTRVESDVRLLEVPLRLIEKYKGQAPDGRLFPVPSNNCCNEHLHELERRCGFRTRLSFHVGRHTFATLALNRGMPIETLSRILGHTNIRTTQIYAKITNKKISQDMAVLAEGLSSVEKDICLRIDAGSSPE
jgi:integrase